MWLIIGEQGQTVFYLWNSELNIILEQNELIPILATQDTAHLYITCHRDAYDVL